jgi:hypothetical protein
MSKDIIYTNDARSTLYPSSQVDSTLPNYITDNYRKFVTFMERANESDERLGFGQNLLQNLQKWRDFDTYQDGVVEDNVLGADVSITEVDEIQLESTYGFPTLNGVILINDEVINYREAKDNKLLGLERGCASTTVLPTFTTKGTYTDSVPAAHLKGTKVENISVLFLMAMGQTISDSFSNNISFRRITNLVDKSILLENLKDFYQSKGSKLGIKTLFKMFFAENDVDVSYPGDRMIKPSSSTYAERQVLRTIQIPQVFCDQFVENISPERILGSELVLKSYLTGDREYAKTFVNYIATYPYESETQYEIYVDDDFLSGDFISNPQSTLTRALNDLGTTPTDLRDIFTVTVESTLGFPDEGILFVENEGIRYTAKSANQFFGCKRGDYGVFVEHPKGAKVYGPYYVEGRINDNGKELISRSWPLGLVESVDIVDEGLLHQPSDEVYINGPGRIDPRDKILPSFIENYNDVLATQAEAPPSIKYIGNFTSGVSGVYFDDKRVFVTSSNLPYGTLGPFSNNGTAGSKLEGDNAIHVIPRRDQLKENPFIDKGTDAIGVFADGVTAISNVDSNKVVQGIISSVVVTDVGSDYITPTLLVDDLEVDNTTFTIGITGDISSIVTESTLEWVGDKRSTTRVTSGEGAVITATFDNYGRMLTAIVTNPGQYYFDTPAVQVLDSTDRGKGAVLKVTNDSTLGTITGVEILNSGIDYNSATSSVNLITPGTGCKAEAIVQFYQFNKTEVIDLSSTLNFDENEGFVFEDNDGELTQYGYVVAPADVKTRLNDDGTKHSPILGWAYDGNPIYGVHVWTNGKNADGGVTEATSGYYLRSSRVGELAGGGKVASNPPSEDTYPMGTFVEDYGYDPTRVAATDLLASSNLTTPPAPAPPNDALIQTDPDDDNIIAYRGEIGTDYSICNEFNGLIANTPEFPEELYPDGVFFYVATVAGTRPVFPYIIGPNFYNRPISQNIRAIDTISPLHANVSKSYTPSVSYEETIIDFDFNKVARFRNPYLSSTKDNLKLEVDTTIDGTISGVEVVNGLPSNSEPGDFLYFDSTGTGGDGAIGEVTMVEGSPVERGFGQNIGTTLISHRQFIDLDYYVKDPVSGVLAKPNYVFVPSTTIETTSGSVATVESFDYQTRTLIVQTSTLQLIQPGDVFFDNDHKVAVARERGFVTYMGTTDVATDTAPGSPSKGMFFLNTVEGVAGSSWTGINGQTVGTNQFIYYSTQWEMATLTSIYDGDLGDSSDFTAALQGFRAYLMYETGEAVLDELTGYVIETEEEKRLISTRPVAGRNLHISYSEPSSYEAKQGDLWWSIINGRLFVYYEYAALDPVTNIVEKRTQWVVSQPMGTKTLVGASDTPVVTMTGTPSDTDSHQMTDNTITIGGVSPSSRPDGSPNILGDLFWSSDTGILYIWVTNTSYVVGSDTLIRSEWVSTDPSAIAPMEGASDVSNPTLGNVNTLSASVYQTSFTASVTCIVATKAPTVNPDGSDLTDGALWWCPLTGRLYVRYTDPNPGIPGGGTYWAVTNPIGSIPTKYAADTLVNGGDTISDIFVGQLPELPTQERLFFNNLSQFRVNDEIRFESTAPGQNAETGTIVTINPGNCANVNRRGSAPVVNGSPTFVTSRYLFTVDTATPHKLQAGDMVEFIPVNVVPKIDRVDRLDHVVREVGTATAPIGIAVIGDDPAVPSEYGEVIGMTFDTLGARYTQPFYIYFYGGGGTGALGYVDVSPIEPDGSGGSIVLESSPDSRFPNGNIKMINSGRGYTTPPAPVYGTELTNSQFIIFTTRLFPITTGFEYMTDVLGIRGKIARVAMKSHGLGYASMPTVLGSYKKGIDQATYDIFMTGSTVGSVEVLSGGSRYVAPTAVFYDLVYPGGTGAQATVTVSDGQITAVTMIDNGSGYIQPRVAFVETQGKYIGLTEDIGKLKSVKVLDPGRNISPDRSLKPEVQIDCRVIVNYEATSSGTFVVGEPVYQGTVDDKLFTAIVKAYDNDKQIVTLTFDPGDSAFVLTDHLGGVLKAKETLIGEQSGSIAMVLREGQSDTPCVIDGVSSPSGFFVNDESMLSRKYAVVQDSYYFSPFSYEISSPIQKKDYETIVRDCVHPVGFALFSNVIVNSFQQSGSFVSDISPVSTTP